ncbi:MAG TPA: ribokinase [Burkholderiaceae bacterium]|nr:ribokinase [Burkholderiaceae bacterium]
MLIVFGSINLDISVRVPHLPKAGETVLGGDVLMSAGGKGANQAHAAALYGVPTAMFGAIGHDAFAEPAITPLRSANVDIRGVSVCASDPTGIAMIDVTHAGENVIVVAPGANLSARGDAVSDATLRESRALLLQLEVDPEESLRLARRAKQHGCLVILNASPQSAGFQITTESLDIVIVNKGELADLCARHEVFGIDPVDQARVLAHALQVDVLVTLGEEGSFLMQSDGHCMACPAMPVSPVDTTGAGDTFAGVFAAAIAAGEPVKHAMQAASVAAGIACTRPGAQIAQPRRAEIDAALAGLGPR